jgi:hypothetical protein
MSKAINTNIITDKLTLKDAMHASRIFRDGTYELTPKYTRIFHISFEINRAIPLDNVAIRDKHKHDIGMLVKSIQLPTFIMKTSVLNQYNRKTNVQASHDYEPVQIIFHDDNIGLIHELWRSYYSYYYSDSKSAASLGAYNRNATQNASTIGQYGHNGRIIPFFSSITMYHMGRGEYVSYQLINPMIKSFGHKQLDYASTELHEVEMTLIFEAVKYDTGMVMDSAVGFADAKYDHLQVTRPYNDKMASPTFKVQSDKFTSERTYDIPTEPFQTSNQTYDTTLDKMSSSNTTGVKIPGANSVVIANSTASASNLPG